MPLPLLIVINGLPGSGKTTLAQRLARDLHVPRFARDGIYETLFDAMECEASDPPPMLGHGAFALMYYSASQLLSVGQPVIVEGFFGRPELRSSEFRQLQQKYPHEPLQLLCQADGQVLVERFFSRMATEDRHTGHQDQAWIEGNRLRLSQGTLEPLSIGGTLIEVDTTTPDRMDYGELVARIRSIMGATKTQGADA